MIKFLLKGILRDKSRSILPIIIVSIGVALTILLSAYIKGSLGGIVDENARFSTGHVKIMTKPYYENKDQIPNDLALLEVSSLLNDLKGEFPEVTWEQRILFGGLIDAPDKDGNTQKQGPASGMALDLSEGSQEIQRMNIQNAIIEGTVPNTPFECLIGDEFAKKLEVTIGDEVTFVGSTVNSSMTFQNFTVAGTIRFGNSVMDKGAIIIDLADAQQVLDMYDAAGEVLGYFPNDVYNDHQAYQMAETFNQEHENSEDEFAPIMLPLKEQNNLAPLLDYADSMSSIFITMFIIVMSVVLWNTGLLGGLRRYQEFGIRLALGEAKGKIYRSLIFEAILIGLIGSVIGTAIGLGGAYYLEAYGIDIGKYLKDSTMLMPNVIKAKVTPSLFFIGFIPGLFAMVLGNMLSGIGIFKRETASLFKELEV